ncbi:unnamed protein product, partial [marine sediment metagenome]
RSGLRIHKIFLSSQEMPNKKMRQGDEMRAYCHSDASSKNEK